MGTTLTRDTLISYAGKRAGNEALATFAQDWLNNLIDTLGHNYKWPELEKVSTGSISTVAAGQTLTVSLPADFGDLFDEHSIVITDSNGNRTPLVPQAPDWYDLLVNPSLTGTPQYAVFDLNAMTWTPYPVPNATYTYSLRYRMKPTRLASDTTIPFANDNIWIQALYVQILQHEDDERYTTELTILERMIGQYLKGYNISPIKSRQVRFNSDRFKIMHNMR